MAALPQGDEWDKGDEEDISEIQDCYCPNCGGGRGQTVMLPTKVPLFREIIIVSLSCPDCSFRNSEVTFGGEIQERGEKIVFHVTCADDLNRQIIKSDSCSLLIPKLEFEIPPGTQRGTISTLEGMLKRAAENLEALQPERLRLGDVDNFHRCRNVIQNLRLYAGESASDDDENDDEEEAEDVFPFDIVLDDPAGNSFIENPHAPSPDPNLKSSKYYRTPTQDMALGLQPSKEAVEEGTIDDTNPAHKNLVNVAKGTHSLEVEAPKARTNDDRATSVKQEVMKFPTQCPHCSKPAETDMCMTDIPHFKEVIIMSLLCEECGYKSNEIKGGGAIPKYGCKITLRVTSTDDLAREVLKSDTAGVRIPELDLELGEGGLDGLYTTVEGLLNKMHERLRMANPFGGGDAALKQHLSNDGGQFSEPSANHKRYSAFLTKLKDMADGIHLPFTLIISDPLGNSFVGPVPKDAMALALQAERDGHSECYSNYVDEGMEMEEYERTHQQNEILGLNDIKTENYQQEDVANGDAKTREYYGTDTLEELPDRLRRLDNRGPDHPHAVAKAPVEGDTTVMGPAGANFAVPSMGQRGKLATKVAHQELHDHESIRELITNFEHDDETFIMNDEYDGTREGMVYKDGAQGLGYYTDMPLCELWKQHHK